MLTIFGIIIFFGAIAVLIYLRIRDRRQEKKSVVETMSDDVWDELAKEPDETIQKSRKFRKILTEKSK